MNLHIDPIDSRSELLERLRQEPRSVLVDEDEKYGRECYLVPLPNCLIGLCSSSHGIKPAALIDEADRAVWLAYSCSIARVDLAACRRQFTIRLDGPFYEVLTQMPDGSLIVIHELGVCRIDRTGNVVWSFSTSDVVTDFADTGEHVWVRTWDEREVRIHKTNGMQV